MAAVVLSSFVLFVDFVAWLVEAVVVPLAELEPDDELPADALAAIAGVTVGTTSGVTGSVAATFADVGVTTAGVTAGDVTAAGVDSAAAASMSLVTAGATAGEGVVAAAITGDPPAGCVFR